ncbi:hypothetical protein Ahy_A04g018615 [Arachis hypogaea]|uniref:FAR1 domain-containing protein n=1 Tax=Arachis hypogaea TaxID=3818 RepID=A0A445DE37_ARAHY|nr:hypothetical protein Ahy_A04g018615 [Arachis hypogaea]
MICANGVIVCMEAKLYDEVNRGAGVQEDASGRTHSKGNETLTRDDNAHSCDKGVEGEVIEYGDVLMLTEANMMRKVFCTDEVAYEFYMRYGKCHGFVISKGNSGKDDEGRVIRRRFFYDKARLRQRKHYERLDTEKDHRSEMCTNCDAKLSILWDEVNEIWRVRQVILDHNHDLTPIRMVHMINNFRKMNTSAKAHINGMQAHVIPTSKILGYIAGQAKEEFEAKWHTTVEEYGLDDSFWAKETYDKWRIWVSVQLTLLQRFNGPRLWCAQSNNKAFQHEHVMVILSILVLKRWHKDAMSSDNNGKAITGEWSERKFLLRHGALHSTSQWFSFVAARSPTLFYTAMNGIQALFQQIKVRCDLKGPLAKAKESCEVKDVVKTKGAPRLRN